MADQILGAAYRTSNLYAPKEGPLWMKYPLQFPGANIPLILDLFREQSTSILEEVQVVYIDNSQNSAALILNFGALQQPINAPPLSQGYYPIMGTKPLTFTAQTATANALVNIWFGNIPMPPVVWYPDGEASPIVYGTNQTPLASSSGNVANAVAAASLVATPGKTNYVSSISFAFTGATAAFAGVATLTGLVGGTAFNYPIAAPAGATLEGVIFQQSFEPPIPANAPNTAITLSVPALGAGNLNSAANISGFQQ